MRFALTITVALALAACDGTIGGEGADAGPGMLPPCDVAVTIDPESASVAPRGVLVLRAAGGTGAHRFAIDDDGGTGTRVADATGVLVAGTLAGTVIVRVDDVACAGSATAEVEVTDGLVLEPGTAEVAPSSELRFAVRGGEGPFEFALASSASGGSVDVGGVYRAGAREGDDVVRVTDSVTGATAAATVRVRTSAGIRAAASSIAIPVGATHALQITGGSGYVEATVTSDAIEVEAGVVSAISPGSAEVELVDRYTGARATVTIDALTSLAAPVRRAGDRSESSTVLGGDFDGDGDADMLIAMPGSGIAGHRHGAVLLYENQEGTLADAPVRTITGTRRDEQLGSSVAVADLDADGRADLIVGAWQADPTGVNVGAVVVWPGVEGSFFAAEPSLRFAGRTGFDRFGTSVAACDFDGDGDVDLAVGAADAENRELSPRNDQEGAVYVFPSFDGRFLTSPGQVIYGAVPDGTGGWRSHDDMRFGDQLAAGDFDGDGRCDLAVRAVRTDPEVGNDGAVLVFRGRVAATDGAQGGVEPVASVAIMATETDDRGSRLGQSLALGDLDGDGRADLALGQHLHDVAGADDVGAARVFRGRALTDGLVALTPSMADWTHEGAEGGRWYGHAVRIGDATGDGLADLVVGDSRAALEGSTLTRPGVLRVFPGRAGGMPSATPSVEIEGLGNEERFGQTFAIVRGVAGGLVALALLADSEGLDDGALRVAAAPGDLRPLDLPGSATGRRYAQSLAIPGDLNGDGFKDLVIGSPHQSDMRTAGDVSRGHDHGAAFVHFGSASGYASEPDLTLFDHPGHSESDWFAEDVAAAGDFDGDGLDDLAVLARYDDQPATFDPAVYAVDGTCPAGRSDTGAVYVFRGVASGMPSTTPAFVIYGPVTSRVLNSVASADANGDGRDDLWIGGASWIDASRESTRYGGVALVRGRAADPTGKIVVVCGNDWLGWGDAANDELGTSLARIGDVDGDGCDEVAAGAPLVDRPGATDEGAVRVFFGFGGTACPATAPALLTLRPFDRTSHAGRAIAAGVDLDADGVSELVIGAPRYTTAVGEIGRVYVVTGAYLAAHRGDAEPVAMVDPRGAVIDGVDPGERAGSGVALVPGLGARGAIAVGGAFAAISGVPDTGGVRVLAWDATGLVRAPLALVSGETVREGSELGSALVAARLGTRTFLAVGASWGNAHAIDSGSAYVIGF